MGNARRNDAILSSDPRAWEWLIDSSSSNPTSAVDLAGRSTEGAVQFARERSSERGPFTIEGTVPRYTTVPTAGEVFNVQSKLVVLRDAVLVPAHAPQEDNDSIFDNFAAKNSSRSSRWGAWHTVPPWAMHSPFACRPATEVRLRLGPLYSSATERSAALSL